jgi:hypothetical protein
MVAVGVNASGRREVLGVELATSEDGAGWTGFLRGLHARGLSGVQLVISDAHPGLVEAARSVMVGAAWQRCRTHSLRNLLTKVPKSAQPLVATLVRSIFAQPNAEQVAAQHERVVDQLAERFPAAAAHLADAASELLAFTGFPKEHWRQIWSTNPQERLRSGRRAANVVSWFIVAQLALGPWRSRGEVRPAELARAMGVSRWTEWRTRLDAARAGLVRDWTLPDPEARGYGRGAVRVLELAFVRTREVTKRVAANREEKASRAERRREARRKAKEANLAATSVPPAASSSAQMVEIRREDLTSPAASRLWELLDRVQPRLGTRVSAGPRAHSPPR